MDNQFIPYTFDRKDAKTMLTDSKSFYNMLDKRRSLRYFSDETFPIEVIENIIMAASTAPSGAHKQPWTFCVIQNPEVKKQIRVAAEQEEEINYEGRMSERWREDLKIFETDKNKPFLELAPYLIVVFKRAFENIEGQKVNNYYVNESVGIASGMLISAIHAAGLCTLTHTPSPMNFLEKVLDRPKNERAFLLLPVGFPANDAKVPALSRKPLKEVMKLY